MKLLDCYLPVFKLATEIASRPEDFSDYDTFRKDCLLRLEEAVHEAEYHDISDFERDQSFFAVVVWLDEVVLCSQLSLAQSWCSNLLQRKYFQTSIGGEMFFDRLNTLKAEHLQARRVFLFCLQNGFNGKYSTEQDRSALKQVVEQQRQLCLPQDWQQWPNNTQITPINVGKRSLISSKHNVLFIILGLSGIYVMLVLFQIIYFI